MTDQTRGPFHQRSLPNKLMSGKVSLAYLDSGPLALLSSGGSEVRTHHWACLSVLQEM